MSRGQNSVYEASWSFQKDPRPSPSNPFISSFDLAGIFLESGILSFVRLLGSKCPGSLNVLAVLLSNDFRPSS